MNRAPLGLRGLDDLIIPSRLARLDWVVLTNQAQLTDVEVASQEPAVNLPLQPAQVVRWLAGIPSDPLPVSPLMKQLLDRVQVMLKHMRASDSAFGELTAQIPAMIGTQESDDEQRMSAIMTWKLKHQLPAWLAHAGYERPAQTIRSAYSYWEPTPSNVDAALYILDDIRRVMGAPDFGSVFDPRASTLVRMSSFFPLPYADTTFSGTNQRELCMRIDDLANYGARVTMENAAAHGAPSAASRPQAASPKTMPPAQEDGLPTFLWGQPFAGLRWESLRALRSILAAGSPG